MHSRTPTRRASRSARCLPGRPGRVRARPPVPFAGLFAGLALQACAGGAPAPATSLAPDPDRTASVAVPAGTPLSPAAEASLLGAFLRARTLVADDTGVSLDDLELVLADDERIDSVVRRETGRLVHAQFDDPAFAEGFVERMMRGQRGTFVALYVPSTDSVLVNRRLHAEYARSVAGSGDVRASALLALMIHEAVHAVDDRRHDIDGTRTLDFRASFAESAVYEGHAQWRTRRLCARAGCLDGLAALDAFMFGDPGNNPPNQIAQSAVALSRNVLEYSYVEGERFVEALATRPDGEAALERLLSAPPADPVQILDPDSWPDAAREGRNRRLFDAAAGFEHPWHARGWARVETSPLKGVNLRADPARRVAAVEGFTRLLVAMGAMELHDQTRSSGRPVEITLLESESIGTARMFARTLHANAPGTVRSTGYAGYDERGEPDTTMLHAELPGTGDTGTTSSSTRAASAGDVPGWRTLVAQHGPWVVQIAASAEQPAATLESWALGTFERLDAGVRTAPGTPFDGTPGPP